MKPKILTLLLTFVLCMWPCQGQPSIRETFEALKGLSGEWRGKDTLGHQAEIRFRVTSSGTALFSELFEPNHQAQSLEDDMITMIHLDGDRLLLTHYCGAGNQPRMKGIASPDGKTITFDFVNATNLSSSRTGHMRQVVIKFISPDHHTELWTFAENGQESKDLFDMWRTISSREPQFRAGPT